MRRRPPPRGEPPALREAGKRAAVREAPILLGGMCSNPSMGGCSKNLIPAAHFYSKRTELEKQKIDLLTENRTQVSSVRSWNDNPYTMKRI